MTEHKIMRINNETYNIILCLVMLQNRPLLENNNKHLAKLDEV